MSKSEKRNDRCKPAMRVDGTIIWTRIDWEQAKKAVAQLQARIVKAQKQGRYGKVKSLTRILTRSFYAKALAVKRVTSNTGKRTTGVDGVRWNTDKRKARAILELQQEAYRAKPLRRILIPKPGSDKKRPLGIPTMRDRAMQALYKMALEPIAETTADPNSYGFRPGRSCHDAIRMVGILTSRPTVRPTWILEGDIKSCYDKISHDWMLEHIPMEKPILRQWLKCGCLEGEKYRTTDSGAPQGAVISPTIANMALDGIETMLCQKYKVQKSVDGKTVWRGPRGKGNNKRVNFIRYADDFIVTANSKELLESEIKPMIREFLAHRGLELSEEKTFVTHLEQGFDFLGFNIRTYKGKLLIKPAEKRVLRIRQKIKDVFDSNKAAAAATLIEKLNPILRGWANYNRHCGCRATFSKLDAWIWKKLWRWACRRHGKKNAKWIKRKYFTRIGNRNWCFYGINKTGKRRVLMNMCDVKFTEHIKIRNDANPFDPKDAEYLARRKKRISLSKINASSSLTTGC
jgi:RNA-directed DNA polymerase